MLGTITLTVVEEDYSASTQNEEPAENMEVVPSEATQKIEIKEQDQDEAPEATNATSDEKEESPEQTNETQSNEVGFKKVFKFVGFKFTVKKDKVEKSEPVQLLTVKQEKVEVNGTENHEKQNDVSDENVLETEETKEEEKQSETVVEPVVEPAIQTSETQEEVSGEKPKSEEETKLEKEQVKTPESPTNPLVVETSSPLKKFFAQGWAGLRKKTSFRKSKEEDHQEVEKHIISEEQEKAESQAKEEAGENQIIVNGETLPKDASETEELKASVDKETQPNTIELAKPEECPADELSVPKEDIKQENVEICEVSATQSIETSVEVVNAVPVPTEFSEQKKEADTTEDKDVSQITVVSTSIANTEEVKETLSEMAPDTEVTCDKDNKETNAEQAQAAINTERTEAEICPEPIMTETELLSSQEKAKLQGSPLKKLFSGTGLRKLSGKKHKGKKEDDTKTEVTLEVPISSDMPEGDGDNTSPSSPEESAETSPTEKVPEDALQAVETEGDGATSDGERKREGITPWASFKKLVTPKKRPKRPSESDKEEEVEKIKTSTMSSTESAGSVENQEEAKENGEEQKLEKSTEENKKKVDNSVSWEALICVGSAKKRARKTSDSDEEETQKNIEENKKIEEDVDKSKECEPEGPIVSSQEKEQVNDSPSPDQATSPAEGDAGSTWQSFKRLVIPRRKSRTRAEEKTEETAVVSNTEQPTSDGEAGKEEGWVSFKKLIPGRKKKKSEGKQEHAAISDAGKSVEGCEAMEDDSDVPAVVPLSEFDAAEQEKREAQQTEDALTDVSKDEAKTPENTSEDLIHAITVTVVEGERAVTSLEDRAPSWISASVTDTVEQANELTEPSTKERIKSEVTVEEAVIFGEVSQMVGSGNTIINEVELTSEALTALEEAIEYSCAEETTEMISAASQLGDSFTPTEEVTPVPEEDEGSQSLDVPDQVLNEAAELAEQSTQALVEKQVEESTCISAEEQGIESTLTSAEQIEECTTVLAESHDQKDTSISAAIKSVIEKDGAYLISVVEHINEIPVISVEPADQADTDAPVATKEYLADSVLLEEAREETSVGSAEVKVGESHADKIADTAEEQDESAHILSENTVEECANVSITSQDNEPVPAKYNFKEVTPISKEVEAPPVKEHVLNYLISAVEQVDIAPEKTVEGNTQILEQELLKELSEEQSNISASTVHEEQVKEVALISDEQETLEHPYASDDLESKEGAIFLAEEQVEERSDIYVKVTESAVIFADKKENESTFVLTETQTDESSQIFVATQAIESVSVLKEELATESDPVVPVEQANNIATAAKAAINASSEDEKQISECSTVMFDEHTEKEHVAESPTHVTTTLTAEIASVAEQDAVKEEQYAEYPHSMAGFSDSPVSESPPALTIEQTMEVTTPAEGHDKASTTDDEDKKATESISVVPEEQEVESLNTDVEEQDLESAIAAGLEQVAESASTAGEEQTKECAPTVDELQVAECDTINVEELSEEKASAASLEHHAETSSVEKLVGECPSTAKEVQVTESATLVTDEQLAEVAAEEHATESAVNLALEKTEESATTLAKESGESLPLAFEECDAVSAPSLAEDQAEESGSTIVEEQTESVCVAELEQADGTAISDSDGQIAASVDEKHSAESVSAEAEEEATESVTLSADEQTAEGITPATVEDTAESAIFAVEEETAKCAISVAKESYEKSTSTIAEESSTAVDKEQAAESVTPVAVEHIEEMIPAAATEELVEENFSVEEQSAEAIPLVTKEIAEETASAAFQEEATDSATVVDNGLGAENAMSTAEGLATDTETPATEEQVPQDVTAGSEEQTDQSTISCTKALTAESVTSLTEEPAAVCMAAPVEEQAVGIVTAVADEQAGENATTPTEEQAVEVTANVTKESAPAEVEVQVIENASAEVEVQVIESASVNTEEQSSDMEQRVENYSEAAPEKDATEKEVIILDEENTNANNKALTFSADMDAPCSVDLNDVVEQQEDNVVMTVEKTPEEMVDGRDLAYQVPQTVNETIPSVAEEHSMQNMLVNISEELTLDSVVLAESLESTALHVPQEEVPVCEQETVPEPTIYSMPVEQQSTTVTEDTVITNIPEFESSEAIKACETVNTAAVQEQILAETVVPIEISADTTEACETAKGADDLSETSGALHTVVQSVSQKAAAIVDAAIEAAASCLVVEAATTTLEQNIAENGVSIQEAVSVCTEENASEDNLVQTITISTISTVQITETSVEKIEQITEDVHIGDEVQEFQHEEHKHSLEVEEIVPVSAQGTEVVVTAEERQGLQETAAPESEPTTVASATGLHDGCALQEEHKETTPVHTHEESLKPADSECTEQMTVQITHTESELSMSISKPVEEIVSQDSAELNTQADSQTVES
ncbi:hypothetical protein XENTR_v10013708 [Xenopus tropicalis]|uniref:A-kinase anchor protein 12 isoform X2 n=1 Tax=Xenopus tropicalis TaxID=8364 RepID=A0A6I8QT52_XENTR|nr:A-kinase anchor protein 12 isoform X2 [Xenopus tropicalis]KAE8601532.1 hypothetical protein XENTR_v10013708 [Xenopus tropicalis]|eukprot:XP_004914715.1 PREDICTED: A-kinase anchor protein 12 isoform X2 [Xenopus tropicalis]